MPYSFTQIEKDKTQTIGFVFSFLIVIYFVVFWVIALLVINGSDYYLNEHRYAFHWLTVKQSLFVFMTAVILGYGHWSYSTTDLIRKMLAVLHAEPLNPKDTYHQKFQNIIDEVSIATGGVTIKGVVVPTMAMNAFALADFQGNAVIGITEGVLARLTRAQIEAVVGHEAAHIVTGDCLATTITSSLFELFNGFLKGFELMFKGRSRGYSSVRVRSGGGGGAIAIIVMIILIYIVLAFSRFLSQIVRLFISRQREYRADAIAVRLTRDPLSLAEALYAIAYRWRGGGMPAQELEAIFIVNPVYAAIDESEGSWAEMFSTHPPMNARLAVLLDMAHADAESMMKNVDAKSQRPRVPASDGGSDAGAIQWMVNQGGQWQGPLDLAQITGLGGALKPETWIQRFGQGGVQMAYEDTELVNIVHNKSQAQGGSFHCPKCRSLPLNLVMYEGVEVYKCPSCHGTLVKENDIQRIIIREEVGFSDKVKRIAQGIQKEEKTGAFKTINRDPKTLLTCPQCQHVNARMMRMFYTEAYHVEIDKCFACGLIWFDPDELEVLQHLIEDRNTAAI